MDRVGDVSKKTFVTEILMGEGGDCSLVCRGLWWLRGVWCEMLSNGGMGDG